MSTKGWGNQTSVENYVLQWREDNGVNAGEGLSRTSNPNAGLYEIVVEFSGMRPMREWLLATSPTQAAKFAANRYPTATNITVLTKKHDRRSSRKRLHD